MIKWTEKIVKVKDLKPFERNPRRMTEKDYERLKQSLMENGYHQRIIATKDLRVIGGHQRIRVLKELGLKEIAVLVPDKTLSAEQFRKLLIQDNLPFGSWDFELLSAAYVESSLNSGLWAANGTANYPTGDGLHASPAIITLKAATAAAKIAASISL